MKFYANPKPTRGIWQLGDTELAVGAESIDKKFKSTVLTEGVSPWFDIKVLNSFYKNLICYQAIDGEWLVTLTINNLDKKDAQAKYKLVISNAEGEAEYGFKLALGPPPPKGIFKEKERNENVQSKSRLSLLVVAIKRHSTL